jgi:hypothetical protein
MENETTTEIREPAEPVLFRTKDLNQAAYFWCLPGADMYEIEGDSKHHANTVLYFKFRLSETTEAQLKTHLFDYANERCKVEPQAYVRKQNNVRDLLHANLRKIKAEREG